MTDETTFFLSFLSIFGALAAYLWHLHRVANQLEAKLDAATAKKQG